jgi:RNA-directed DNA polymerase
MNTTHQRHARRAKGLPTWRIVRYADDFVVLVHGHRPDVETLREDIARVLAPLGLRLSPAKTRVVHMSEGFDFLGFRIQWRRKRGTNQWYVYTFIADRPLKAVKAKIRAMTHRGVAGQPRDHPGQINQILRGWANYLTRGMQAHAQQPEAFCRNGGSSGGCGKPPLALEAVLAAVHHPRAVAAAVMNGTVLFNPASVTVTRYRYRGAIPTPWATANHA